MNYPLYPDNLELSTLIAIDKERGKQIEKFGEQKDKTDLESLSIVAEEFGEVSKEICSKHNGTEEERSIPDDEYRRKLKKELKQLATTALAFYERINL